MKDDYPFHLPPSFFTYSNAINLDFKLSIIQALAQDYSIQKTYYVQSFLNQFKSICKTTSFYLSKDQKRHYL